VRWRARLSVRTRLTVWYSAVLLGILVTIGALSYAWLRSSLVWDLDASLLTVAQVIHDAEYSRSGPAGRPDHEALLRELLGRDFYDQFIQLLDPDGQPHASSSGRRGEELPLSAQARVNAARGERTIETVAAGGQDIRVLTMPIVEGGRVAGIIQTGMSLRRTRAALGRYLEILVVLIPLGVGLAAVGGAIIARAALQPVDEMTRTARRITAEDLRRRVEHRGSDDELDRLARTLNDMLARLEEAFSQTRRFAADAAHELRTPLTVLKGGMEVALRIERPVGEYRTVLASSLEEVERLIRLAEDLLLLSRVLAGPEVPRVPVELEPLLLEVFDVGVRLGSSTGVSVRVGDAGPATVHGDAMALRRAVLNMVENAVKYTPAGGKVELGLTSGDRAATITVADTGIGMEPAETKRIFEPFVRLDAARGRDTGGTGLGLAIARSIVIAHGGTLTVETGPGAGSRFTISLPLA